MVDRTAGRMPRRRYAQASLALRDPSRTTDIHRVSGLYLYHAILFEHEDMGMMGNYRGDVAALLNVDQIAGWPSESIAQKTRTSA